MSKLETARQLAKQTLQQERDLEIKFQKQVSEKLETLKNNQIVIFNRIKIEHSQSKQLCTQISNHLLRQQDQIKDLLSKQKRLENRYLITLMVLAICLILVFLKMD